MEPNVADVESGLGKKLKETEILKQIDICGFFIFHLTFSFLGKRTILYRLEWMKKI